MAAKIEKAGHGEIYCLFHQTAGCLCLNPVVDKEDLIKRLAQEITLKNFLNGTETNATTKRQRTAETIGLKLRLQDLSHSGLNRLFTS